MRYLTFYLPVFLIMILVTSSCDKTPLGYSPYEGAFASNVNYDGVSGTYVMYGIRVTTSKPCYPCTIQVDPRIDTTQISFELEIRLITAGGDSASFWSHEEGEFGAIPSFPSMFDGNVYVTGSQINYDILATGYIYTGEGEITDGRVTLSTFSHYRNRTVENELTGILKEGLSTLE